MGPGGDHVETVERHHSGDSAERSWCIAVDDRQAVVVDTDVQLAARHQRHRVGVGEEGPGCVAHVTAADHVGDPVDQLVDQPLLPGAPGRRPGRLRVGHREGVQQFEHLLVPDRVGHRLDRRRVGEIAPHRDVGEQ